MRRVTALIVTYNRLNLLKESICAVLNQEFSINHVIVIDNNSSDGTSQYLQSITDPRVIVKKLNKNLGGAGGFYEGVRYFQDHLNDDFLWIMDDDTIPSETCLNELYSVATRYPNFGFLASNVRWVDGTPAAMNIPSIDGGNWNASAQSAKDPLYPVLKSASFVSLLVSRTAISKVGLPIKEFFIWGDDVEFTERISNNFRCYFVPQSIAIHKTKTNTGVNIIFEKNRLNRYFYDVRNKFYRAKKASGGASLKLYSNIIGDLLKVSFKRNVPKRWKKIQVILKGIIFGVFFNPKVDFAGKKH